MNEFKLKLMIVHNKITETIGAAIANLKLLYEAFKFEFGEGEEEGVT